MENKKGIHTYTEMHARSLFMHEMCVGVVLASFAMIVAFLLRSPRTHTFVAELTADRRSYTRMNS